MKSGPTSAAEKQLLQPVVTQQSTRSLLIANAVTLAMALIFQWPLSLLLWPYWIQSVVIGYFSGKRLLALQRFSTEDVLVNDQPVEPTEATKHSAVLFFVLHYGFFHLGYAFFIATRADELGPWDWIGITIAALGFAWNHRFSYQQNIAADAAGMPNIGTLMFLPYLRILPMHATILAGGVLTGSFSVLAVVAFCLLKTGADVAMHLIEHKLLQRQS